MRFKSGIALLIVVISALLLPAVSPGGQMVPATWMRVAKAQGYDCSAQSEVSQTQCEALVALYENTNGPSWTNDSDWLATTSPCTWFGISCDGSNVVSISMPDNGLSGTLPVELGNLSALENLLLYSNALTGSIPTQLGNLSSLESLSLNNNALSGAIPSELGNLSNLTTLYLSINQLSGSIPPELGNLSNLTALWLDQNALTGGIPTQLGNLSALLNLALYTNQLSGPIPSELGDLSNLAYLHLASNALMGEIPVTLGNLSNLEYLALNNNALTGSIPPQLGNLANLTTLYLSVNLLSGSIPAQLGNLSNLQDLYLSTNQLSGPIPPELGNLSNLAALWVDQNALTGGIPTQLGNLSALGSLALYTNQLSGPIPTQLGNLSNLQYLALNTNDLSGSIPTQLGSLANLQTLYLSDNELSGAITVEVGNLANLVDFWADTNALSGAIPAELGDLANLVNLSLYSNDLTGSIPSQLGNLANLQSLNLSINQLSGPIPTQLGNLSNLQYLALNNNDLSGSIPTQLGSLANLQTLYLSDNELSGAIPVEVGNLANLVDFWADTNALSGAIPAELGDLANLVNLSLYSNDLTGSIPAQLGNLSNLKALQLSDNALTGSIPTQLGNLTSLESLSLNNNALSGSIPPELGNLSNLTTLYLSINQLSGSIPPELGNLSNLTALWLDQNTLTGGIPTQFGNLSALRSLALFTNQLSGPIPSELGDLSNLAYLHLASNALTGEIPVTLGNLSNLEYLALNNNALTGSIPSQLGDLSNLQDLYLSTNQLSGPIPPELGNLGNLTALWLDQNALTGGIPTQLGNLSDLVNLALYTNQLSGGIPSELGNLAVLETLHLSDNDLEGTIPATLGNAISLTTFFVNNNALIGELPDTLGNLAQLVGLDVANNPLIGPLPTTLSNLALLNSFNFGGTGLCVPEENGALTDWLAAVPVVNSSGLACGEIPAPSLVIVPNAARAGVQVRAIGDRFQPNGPYSFRFTSAPGTSLGSTVADATGQFDVVLSVPDGFSAPGTTATLEAVAEFEPVGVAQSALVQWLPPLALSLSPTSARPGATVTATVANLYTGTLAIVYNGAVVAGPVVVGSGEVALPFVVPAGGTANTPLDVEAQNGINGLPLGRATAAFTPLPAETFDFEEQPNAEVEVVTEEPPPPWQGDAAVTVIATFPDIPAEMREDVEVDIMFADENGNVFPLTDQPLGLDGEGNINAQVRLPSLLAGDPVPSTEAGDIVVTAHIGDEVKTVQTPAPTEASEPPFSMRIVRTGTGALDGTNIPDSPQGSLRFFYRVQGIAYADSAELESATFYNALDMAFRTVYADQIGYAISTVVNKYFECHPFIEQREVQPWEIAWRPPDIYKLIADQQSLPVLQIGNMVKQINQARAATSAALSAAQPDAINAPEQLVEVRFLYVTVDATGVVDGSTAPNGYGPPETIQDRRKVVYNALYALIPSTGAVYLVRGFDERNLLASLTFERLPAGPVIIALRPYPAGALARLQFDVSVPNVNVLDVTYAVNANGSGTSPVRTYGHLFSFKDFPGPLSFEGDNLEIYALVNDGYAGLQVPASAVKMTLYPAGGGAGIVLPVKQQNFGSDPCKSQPRVRFVGTLNDGGRALAPGRHQVVVEVNDGLDKVSHRIYVDYQPTPDYFRSGLKNRRVIWSPAKTELSATRYDSSDTTKVPGDLQVAPPKGPPPSMLHVDNESGLDNRIFQTLTPSGPGAVRQTHNSSAKAWNTGLPQGVSSAAQTSAASFATARVAANRPTIPCNKNNPYEYCIGPKSYGVPRKEIMLFPPILWGLPGLADIKIAGTLAYLAGVDISGVARAAIPPEVTMQVWPYAEVSVAIDIAAEILGGLIGRLGLNTSANVHADVPVVFSTAGKNDANACFRWFVTVRIYVQAGCIPFTDACLYEDDIDKRNILDGREPNSPFCNAQGAVAAAALEDLPPSANPAIATDGIHMLAIWNTTANELVYSHFDGNRWSPPFAIDSGRIAERATVAYFDANRAIAVWNGSTLTQPGNGPTLDNIVAAQVLEYALWDGTTWSAPARLAPQSSGDGGAVLASCMAGATDCPIGGEVTAAWTHIEEGALSDLELRVYTARFVDSAWQAPQAADAASTSLDTAPMVAYTNGAAVVGWVRDADASFTTTGDRRIALRNLTTNIVEVPQALPTGVVAGSLAVDSEGQLLVSYTRAADGALLSNHHEIVAARQSCPAGCTWSAQTLIDQHGRALLGEHPVLTVDSQNRATITYRATGFGPDALGNLVYPGDAPGVTVGVGELAQIELNAQFAAATPRALTRDGVLNWEPAAVYNPGLNQIVALSVRGPVVASVASSASIAAQAQALDEILIFATSARQPDFVVEAVTPFYPSPTATVPSTVSVTIANWGAAPDDQAGLLEVAIAWDVPPLAAQVVTTAALPLLHGGAVTQLSLALPPLGGTAEASHLLYVTVNARRAITESDWSNNEFQLVVAGVPAPEQVYVTANPLDGLFHLRWYAPERSEPVAGYRIYRREGESAWQAVGSSFGTEWADVNADFNKNYEYAVSAYTASGYESALSESMLALMTALPEQENAVIFLPSMHNQNAENANEDEQLYIPSIDNWGD